MCNRKFLAAILFFACLLLLFRSCIYVKSAGSVRSLFLYDGTYARLEDLQYDVKRSIPRVLTASFRQHEITTHFRNKTAAFYLTQLNRSLDYSFSALDCN